MPGNFWDMKERYNILLQLCMESIHFGGCEHTHLFIITYYNELWTKNNQVTISD